jgi:topoisomerase-4 subunit B
LRKDGVKDGAWSIARFKGLGEMNAEQLWETTMNPDTRRLLPVAFNDYGIDMSEARFNMLMGKGEAAARRAWLEEHGNEAEADI